MTDSREIKTPPWTTNFEGKERHVGVEVEFAGLSVPQAAGIVQALLGGEMKYEDPHACAVTGSSLGDFEVELDADPFHPGSPDVADFIDEIEHRAREWAGDLARAIVPVEVVTPPIPWSRLGELSPLMEELRAKGALGTSGSFAYGFGLHLNPDIASTETAYLRDMIRSWLLLSDWMRREIRIDSTRDMLPFANPFPQSYKRHVLAADYAPDQGRLIDDYLHYNPTRNRELDLLPLFAWLDEDRVRHAVKSRAVKPRPTFHYRLPNCDLDNPDWSIGLEWSRWVLVEELAADSDRLNEFCRRYLEETPQTFWDWLEELAEEWF